jgi:hypothetical protein
MWEQKQDKTSKTRDDLFLHKNQFENENVK